MFKGEVQPRTERNPTTNSFAFPSGWDFETIYNLTVKNAMNVYHFQNQTP